MVGLGAPLTLAATWECCDITTEVAEGIVTYEAVLPTALGGEVAPRQVLLDLWLEQTGGDGFLEATVALAGDAEQLGNEGAACLREGFLIQQGSSGLRAAIDVTGLVRSLGPSSVSRLYFRLSCEPAQELESRSLRTRNGDAACARFGGRSGEGLPAKRRIVLQ
jgi:hypothetical protein